MRTAIALAFALAASTANAAPVHSTCTGKAERKILLRATYSETMTIEVDVENNTLSPDGEPLAIASASNNIVTVNSSSSLGDEVWVFFNQMTGALLVTTFNGRGQLAWEFEAVCTPTTEAASTGGEE
jgi:hypothetical protein